MGVDRQIELIHAEIDGELDAQQRAELSRHLLSDPDIRALRDDLRGLCAALDATAQAEPPPDLQDSILAALPVGNSRSEGRLTALNWRHAAAAACLVAVGGVLFFSLRGQTPPATDVAGTLAASSTVVTLDTAAIRAGPLSGQVTLIREDDRLAVRFELTSSAPVDAVIASDGHTVRVPDVTGGPGSTGVTAPLPTIGHSGQQVNLTFLSGDRQIGSAVLRAPKSE